MSTDNDTPDVIRSGWGLTDALCPSVYMWGKGGELRAGQVGVKGETLINTEYQCSALGPEQVHTSCQLNVSTYGGLICLSCAS